MYYHYVSKINNNNNNNNKLMNKNIDLTKILKNCPKGFKLYSLLHGEVSFTEIDETSDEYSISYEYPIIGYTGMFTSKFYLTRNGTYSNNYDGECILFPSREQRDWSKFTAPWYKKEKFDPKTLKPFDKVLIRDYNYHEWCCTIFSHQSEDCVHPYDTASGACFYCIPYNNNTKHLVGTTEEAPEYYRYWED